MRLTPDILAASYALLRETEPFCRWKLPPADEMRFRVVDEPKIFGKCHTAWKKREFDSTRRYEISISRATVHTLDRLLRVMAHEIIHVRQSVTAASGTECLRKQNHGDAFFAMEQKIIKYHQWDFPL